MIEIDVHEEKGRIASSEAIAKLEKGISDGLMALALMAQGEAQKSILRGRKSGRIYRRGKRTHQASAPGEAPANDLGFLANNIKAELENKNTANLISNAPYSIHLEYGTRNMAARPFLRPAGDKIREKAQPIMDAYVKDALK